MEATDTVVSGRRFVFVVLAMAASCSGSPVRHSSERVALASTAPATAVATHGSASPPPVAEREVIKQLPPPLVLPPEEVRVAMVDALRSQIERLDGDGLIYRASRPEPWSTTLNRLRDEAREATTLPELGRVFRRIDATYPNLHSYTVLGFDLDSVVLEGRVRLPFAFAPRSLERGLAAPAFEITRINDALVSDVNAPQVGDELLAINDRPMAEWVRENQIFCDFPLPEQCAFELYDNFRTGLLFWARHQPLALTLRRGTQTVHAGIAPGDLPIREPITETPCGVTPGRYPGFHPVYTGQHACVFESPERPGIAVLRIDSFSYRGRGEFHRVMEETDALHARFWNEHASHVRRLIIDVIDNHGGDMPIGYYRLLFTAPFQEQYASFRRITELDEPRISAAVFWGNEAMRHWRDALESDGAWQSVPIGGFLPPVPQFCTDPTRDCREGRFEPYPHGFHGTVSVMTDPWCVSSCAGFVWELHDVMGRQARVFGLPDSGDTSYSRVTITVSPDPSAPNGVRTAVESNGFAREPEGDPPWIAQVVSVTRTVDARGHVLSGMPQRVDGWVPRLARMSDDDYAAAVLSRVLASR